MGPGSRNIASPLFLVSHMSHERRNGGARDEDVGIQWIS